MEPACYQNSFPSQNNPQFYALKYPLFCLLLLFIIFNSKLTYEFKMQAANGFGKIQRRFHHPNSILSRASIIWQWLLSAFQKPMHHKRRTSIERRGRYSILHKWRSQRANLRYERSIFQRTGDSLIELSTTKLVWIHRITKNGGTRPWNPYRQGTSYRNGKRGRCC